MFYIDKLTGEVDLNRGDNATFTLHINQGSNLNPLQYKLKKEDTIYFAIEEPNQPFENAIVKKVINLKNNLLDKNGNITFEITPNDTVLLMPGLYYYEIKAKLYKGNQYRNSYLVVSFDDNRYNIFDEETSQSLSNGIYNKDNQTLTDIESGEIYNITFENNFLQISGNSNKEFVNLIYKQEQDIVNTIIQQTKWIVER